MRCIALNFEIIDFHTHPFLLHEDNICYYKDIMNMSYESFAEDMAAAGVSRFAGSVIHKCPGDDLRSMLTSNEMAYKLSDLYGEKYIPGIHIHPAYPEESVKAMDEAHARGVKLIGELVPYFYNWSDYSAPEFSELLDYAEKYGMTVSLHTIDLSAMERMALEHKNINFVFAHPGEKAQVMLHEEVMKKCDNVYLDLSGTGLFRHGMLKYLTKSVGAQRILFGTDYPVCNLRLYIGGMLDEGLSDSELELIFAKNAKRLLGI